MMILAVLQPLHIIAVEKCLTVPRCWYIMKLDIQGAVVIMLY